MPEFTIYAKVLRTAKRRAHKIANIAVIRLHDYPLSWYDLKDTLADTGKTIYYDYNKQIESEISIDRHLAGRYKMGMINYRDSRIRTNRIPEFKAKIIYNPRLESIKLKAIAFITPEFYEKYKTDYDLDIKKKWVPKPVVPVGFEAQIMNPDAINWALPVSQAPNYADPITIGVYGTSGERHHESGPYEAIPHGIYGSVFDGTVEHDQAERRSKLKG
jgi:hypothetical protein